MKEVDKVERYLQRATRGLWGRRRGEVREELAAHIEERVMSYRLAGLGEAEAVERTLREMGEPGEVSVGMTKLYTAPWVAGSGILAAAVCAVTVTVASMGMAQTLQTTKTFPSPNCLESANTENLFCQDAGAWTTVEALREVLGPQGVALSREGETLNLRFADGTLAKADASSVTVFDENNKKRSQADQPRSDYFNLWFFLRDLGVGSPLPVQIEGWQDLSVQVGDASFALDFTQKQAESFYYDYLTSIAFNPNQLLANASRKNPTQLNTAVLVRLTGTSKSGIGFGYEVVPPEQISVVN